MKRGVWQDGTRVFLAALLLLIVVVGTSQALLRSAKATAAPVRPELPPPTPYRFSIAGHLPQPSFPADNRLTSEGVALGQMLFFSNALSRDGQISCASCHHAENAFSDPRRVSVGIGNAEGKRNAMPLFNLAWRRTFFWDGRVATLREQVLHPIQDPTEMGMDLKTLEAKLNQDAGFVQACEAAFGRGERFTSATIAKALEQFLLVQISQDSKFDKAKRGEVPMTAQELRGLELFFQEYDLGRGIRGADCFHCHGNMMFTNERFANNGLDAVPQDLGRGAVTHEKWETGQFKVPSLRNVELTGPYMHDGRFRTLEQVVAHYDHGVKASDNLDPNLAKHGGPINLTDEEKAALVAFLKTLTDHAFVERAKLLRDQATSQSLRIP